MKVFLALLIPTVALLVSTAWARGTSTCYVAKLSVGVPAEWVGQDVVWTLVLNPTQCGFYGCNVAYPNGGHTRGAAALFANIPMRFAGGYQITAALASDPTENVTEQFSLASPPGNPCIVSAVPSVTWQL